MNRQYILLILLPAILIASTAVAGVRFLVQDAETQYNDVFSDTHAGPKTDSQPFLSKCEEEGYRYTACSNGMILRGRCPYNSMYYADCCPEDYKYTAAQCRAMGKETSTYSCAGLYACY